MKQLLFITLCFSTLLINAEQIILFNAKVQTLDAEHRWAEAICIRDGQIIYVGTDKKAKHCFADSKSVKQLNAEGKVVLPGFIDSHMHIFSGSSSATTVNLSLAENLTSLKEALTTLANQSTQSVIYARGWQNHIFDSQGPRKTLLDEIFSNRIVILGSVDGHSTWFSSAAMKAAGINKSIKDPKPGISFWERDAKTGELLGTSREGAGSSVINKLLTRDKAFYKQSLQRWLAQANRSGLTTVFDAGMRAPTEEQAWQILAELKDSNELSLKVFGVAMDTGLEPEELINRLKYYQTSYGSELVKPVALKLLADGVPEAHTAFMFHDYLDRPGDKGMPITAAERLTEIVIVANKADIPVHIHAIGDAAIDMSISAIEQADNKTIAWQNAIAHMDFIRTKDIQRLKQQSITAQQSIQWATIDPSFHSIGKFVGEATMIRAYPSKSLLSAGINLSLGSDWPAASYLSTFKPLTLIEVGITRRLPGYEQGPIRNESEQITQMQALDSITMGSARQLGVSDDIGSLEVGKQADLIMLAEDIFNQPVYQIHTNYSIMTMVNGKIVYQDQGP